MFVIYSCPDEVIVCTDKTEKKTIKEFFIEGGRNLNEYEREESADIAVSFIPEIRLN